MGLLKLLPGLWPQSRNFLGDSQLWSQAPDPPAVVGAAQGILLPARTTFQEQT